VSALWLPVLAGAVGCYVLKLAGLSVPARVLQHPAAERVADLLPVALLAALVAVQVFGGDRTLELDARAVGLAAALVALVLRAPFIVVVAVAALAAALVRLM